MARCRYCGRDCSCNNTVTYTLGDATDSTTSGTTYSSNGHNGIFWVVSSGNVVDDVEDIEEFVSVASHVSDVHSRGFRSCITGGHFRKQNGKGFRKWVCKGARI
jgi:parallel beta-helix repeat protein